MLLSAGSNLAMAVNKVYMIELLQLGKLKGKWALKSYRQGQIMSLVSQIFKLETHLLEVTE